MYTHSYLETAIPTTIMNTGTDDAVALGQNQGEGEAEADIEGPLRPLPREEMFIKYPCVCMYIYIYICMCVYICMYTRLFMYTHMHMHHTYFYVLLRWQAAIKARSVTRSMTITSSRRI